jgi:hypothetical protein
LFPIKIVDEMEQIFFLFIHWTAGKDFYQKRAKRSNDKEIGIPPIFS